MFLHFLADPLPPLSSTVKMRLFRDLLLAGQVLGAVAQQWPIHNDGLNSVVEWDHYSLMVNGERLFFWSGEFHYWRIPVPELWRDIMEKIKAGKLFLCHINQNVRED